jgi:ferric-chelate reductase (NADPH)
MSTRNADTPPTPQPPPAPGRLTRTLLRWMMRPARVAAVQTLSPRFRLVALEGDGLKGVEWLPGHKIQVAIGSGFSTRTYTPISWDADAGQMTLLAFLHGDGPGSHWAGTVREGDACQLFGPRRSVDLSDVGETIVLFGDETAFGIAAALQCRCATAELVFEVSDAMESREVLKAIGLGRATLIERRHDNAHLTTIGDELIPFVARGARFVLTGKAQSIQSVSQVLKKGGMKSSNVKSRAYWSPEKTGLD